MHREEGALAGRGSHASKLLFRFVGAGADEAQLCDGLYAGIVCIMALFGEEFSTAAPLLLVSSNREAEEGGLGFHRGVHLQTRAILRVDVQAAAVPGEDGVLWELVELGFQLLVQVRPLCELFTLETDGELDLGVVDLIGGLLLLEVGEEAELGSVAADL